MVLIVDYLFDLCFIFFFGYYAICVQFVYILKIFLFDIITIFFLTGNFAFFFYFFKSSIIFRGCNFITRRCILRDLIKRY